MKFERASGVLLHPTSLPGPYGIGDLGPQAHRWVDFLAEAGCRLWQVLPLGPTGYADSPYACFSAFAGNPYLISLDLLIELDLLAPDDLRDVPRFPAERVDYGAAIAFKMGLLNRAYGRFLRAGSQDLRQELERFCAEQAGWLDDYALFMLYKQDHALRPWWEWPEGLRARDPALLERACRDRDEELGLWRFLQFLFYRQWLQLRDHANRRGVRIIGDIPIFVAADSADAWSNPHLFFTGPDGRPSVVAGVPPDYFSPTGQLWGNPLYRWEVHAASGYAWWIERFRSTLRLYDYVRLDHFRGFAGYWEVPASNPTAEIGRWMPGPGAHFLQAVRDALGDLPILAEDLGDITPDVIALRDQFGLPGMKILQFAFSGPDNPFLPHNFPAHCVAYTGTHDNDTSRGWFESAPERERDFALRYLHSDGHAFAHDLIRAVWASVAVFAIAPWQDFLNLGSKARMNLPGTTSGNWQWRMPEESLNDGLSQMLRELNYLYRR